MADEKPKRPLKPEVAARYTTALNPESAHILPGVAGRKYLDEITIPMIEKLHEQGKCKDTFVAVEPVVEKTAAKNATK